MKNGIDNRKRERVVRALYGAAMGAGSWPEAMRRLAHYTGSRFVSLDAYDMTRSVGSVHACNIPPDHPVLVEYVEANGTGHELIERAFPHQSRGAIMKASDIYPTRKLHETEIYHSLFRPLDMKHVAGITLELGPDSITEYSFIKPHDAPEFSDREMRVLQDLQPDLIQVWHGYRHLMSVQQQLNTLQTLWDHFEHAVVVIDNRRRIQFSNRAAESLLRAKTPLRSRSGRLHGSTPAIQARLKSATRALAEHHREIFSLTPEAATNPDSTLATLFRIADDRLALILTDPARSNHDFTTALQQCYQMTATEADLVNSMLTGQSLRDYADEHEITYETARTHLKNTMRKNGWTRQVQMVSEVMNRLLPAQALDASRRLY